MFVDFNNKKEEEEQSVISPPLPKSVSCKTLGSECRDLLDQIKSLTYTCQNDDALTVLQQQLLVSLKKIKESSRKENGLVVENIKEEQKNMTKKRRVVEKEIDTRAMLPLPPKRQKHTRVGRAAEEKQKNANQFLDIATGKIGRKHLLIIMYE